MPKLSLSGPAELLTVLPLHLGFQPERSVVVVCFHGRRLGLVARLDIPPADLVAEVAGQCLPALDREAPTSVALVGYETVAGESDALVDELGRELDLRALEVADRLVVRGGRWHCTCPTCPPSGSPLRPAADVPAAAGYVALGACALPSREAVTALFRPAAPASPGHDEVAGAAEHWQERHAAAREGASRATTRTALSPPPTAGGAAPVEAPTARAAATAGEVTPGEGATPAEAAMAGEVRPSEVTPGGAAAGEAVTGEGPAGGRSAGDTPAMDRGTPVEEALAAWGALLVSEAGLELDDERLGAAVGCLRDPAVRDGLIAWLCPGSLPLEAVSPDLLPALAAHLGPVGRSTGSTTRSGAGPGPARRRTRERSRRRRNGPGARARLASVSGRPSPGDDSPAPTGADGWDGWLGDEWDAPDRHRVVQQRLEAACRRTPPAHAAPLLSVAASFAWWCGDGARAGAALDVALDLEPDHRLSQLLRQLVAKGIRPRASA